MFGRTPRTLPVLRIECRDLCDLVRGAGRIFVFMLRRPLKPTLLPYTTLFRSEHIPFHDKLDLFYCHTCYGANDEEEEDGNETEEEE